MGESHSAHGSLAHYVNQRPSGLRCLPVIRAATDCNEIVGADINELAPRPGMHGCDFLAAKLVYKVMNYVLASAVDRPDFNAIHIG